ncbi:MAG TPA: MotA/TolQ/ExbB proton channel family protein, partial [Gammaproteobacteria bacterium]|nr:MotA/TolQ/ExbB proton channel family protein [Gammaproteobacteria bacterium]
MSKVILKNTLLSVFVLLLNFGVVAQEESESVEGILDPVLLEKLKNIETMEKLLEITKTDSITTGMINEEREEKFLSARNSQRELLEEAKIRLDQEEERSVRLQKEFEENEKALEEIGETLRIRIGNFGELFGVVRQVSGEAIATVKNSLVSIQYPGREESLAELVETRNLPNINQMKGLIVTMLEEMTKSGNVERFNSQVILPGGSIADAEVVRIGVFNAITESFFLKFIPETQTLQVLARQPARRFRSLADNLFDLEEGYTTMAVDPSRGQILGLLIQAPGIGERINQGGLVGYFIIFIGLLGLTLSGWRLKLLKDESDAINRQLKSDQASDDNALGRILSVFDQNQAIDPESLELKIDEAILREVPKLEKFHSIIKVFAAIAPLLGLLGTVVGMIVTF